MQVATVVAIFGISLLAGCVSVEEPKDAPTETDNVPVEPGDLDPNSQFGVVQGTVLTDEQAPVAGAMVGLRETSFAGPTDASGVFVFRDVPPGTYALDVGALGYAAQARQVEVVAGQITSLSLFLAAIQVASEVYYEIVPHTGFFDCALATAAWISACSYPYTAVIQGIDNGTCDPIFGLPCVPGTGIDLTSMGAPKDLQDNRHRFNITIRQNVGQLQAELVWTPTSAAATRMMIQILCGDYDPVWDECVEGIRYGNGNGQEGTSPVKAIISGKEIIGKGNGSDEYDLTKRSEIWLMNYVGLPFGDPQVALAQRFDIWDTVFYNGEGPEDWSVIPDV